VVKESARGELEEGGEEGEPVGGRQITVPGGCQGGERGRKVRREMKHVKRAAEESGSGS